MTLYVDTIGLSEETQMVISSKRGSISHLEDLIETHYEKRGRGWKEHVKALQVSINRYKTEIDEILF